MPKRKGTIDRSKCCATIPLCVVWDAYCFRMIKNLFNFILSVAAMLIVALIVTFPATWLLMLFLGNVMDVGPSYWGSLPGGILLGAIIGASGHNDQWNVFVRSDNY